MQLKAALTRIQESPDLPGLFVIVLSGYDDPLIFLTSFYQRLKRTTEVTFLDTETATLNECKAQLEMSFLGTRRLYILKHLSALDVGQKKAWHNYLAHYEGPHGVIFFESLGAAKRGRSATVHKSVWSDTNTQLIIELPDSVDAPLYKDLFTFFYPGVSIDPQFLKSLFAHYKVVTLDDAFRFMAYQTVVGRQNTQFFQSWVTRLVVSETSLFTLSEHFFSRNPKQFFRLWKSCKEDYPPEFWVAYWSEQIWQATQYIQRARQFGVLEARKGVNRLPFTFINTDYQKHSSRSLAKAHDELYILDYSLKNGAEEYGLELWYHKFLA